MKQSKVMTQKIKVSFIPFLLISTACSYCERQIIETELDEKVCYEALDLSSITKLLHGDILF